MAHSEETKLKISRANKGRKHSDAFRQMRREMMFGKRWSEESKEKKRKTWARLWNDPVFRENYGKKMKKSLTDPLSKNKRIEKIKKKYADPEFKKIISEQRKGRRHSTKSEFKKGITPWNKGKKGVMSTPWNKGRKGLQEAWNKGQVGIFHHGEEAKIKIRARRAKQIFPKKDSIPEIKIQGFLNQLNIKFIPHKYIGEIKHRYQCDIFIPSLNLVIEVDGDYWHGNKNNPRYKELNDYQKSKIELDKIRTNELIGRGYKVLRLWESEIKTMKLDLFHKTLNKYV